MSFHQLYPGSETYFYQSRRWYEPLRHEQLIPYSLCLEPLSISRSAPVGNTNRSEPETRCFHFHFYFIFILFFHFIIYRSFSFSTATDRRSSTCGSDPGLSLFPIRFGPLFYRVIAGIVCLGPFSVRLFDHSKSTRSTAQSESKKLQERKKNRSASVPPLTASRNRADGATSGPTGDCPFHVAASRGFMIIWRTRRNTRERAKGETNFSLEASKMLGS